MNGTEEKQNEERRDRETEKKTIRLSVRAFVEFLLRSGDLDSRRGGWADREAMQAGARAHRKIQKSRGSSYRAEVPMKWEKEYPEYVLLIEGRADGIFEEEEMTVIEEIKGTYGDPERMDGPSDIHLAQAKCYAYMTAVKEQKETIRICMTYVQLETEEIRRFFSEESRESLERWFCELVTLYEPWAAFLSRWEGIRDTSIRGLEFPFPYREGQKGLVADIYRTILRKKQVFVQAPTGVGKTVSALYPAVRAMGEGLVSRIFYLTAKNTTGITAEETFAVLKERGLFCKALTLTAREKICIKGEVRCDPAGCPFAEGHYDRINDVLYRTLTRLDTLDRTAIRKAAEEGRVCPYEMQSDLTAFADAIIGDYNYAFDPNARLKPFFGEERGQTGSVFLIDEAHNLADRGREMFSADLVREEFMFLRRELSGDKDPFIRKVCSSLRSCTDVLLKYRKESASGIVRKDTEELILPLLRLSGLLEDLLAVTEEGERRETLLAFYFRVSAFLTVYERTDTDYVIYGHPVGKRDYYIKLFCVNPAGNLQKVLDKGRSAVFFSATLVPVGYYREQLSGRTDDYAIAIPSPFPAENRRILVGTDVSTRYERRTEEEFRNIAEYIAAAVSQKKGNYMVYFPSYQMLENVCRIYTDRKQKDETLLVQTRDMKEEERTAFLRQFREEQEHTLTGFCVMGGSFSEGIDLRGEELIGAVIVGTGIPQIGRERELLKEYYGRNGFAYAYRIPGMNKVLQAGGRVIRTMQDRGWILLLDERFAHPEYRTCFPPSWDDRIFCTRRDIASKIREFWDSSGIQA